MLTFWDNKTYAMCDGISRRDFFMAGALGLGGFTLADLLRLKAHGAAKPRSTQKSIIMVYLPGGPSHIDTFDLKPDAPSEVRGEYKPIDTNVSGTRICEKLPNLAKLADKFSIVRTLKFAGHHESHELITGVGFLNSTKRPAFGSVISRICADAGKTGALPPYVSLGYWTTGSGSNNEPEYPAYLGSAHWPFRPVSTGHRGKSTQSNGLDSLTVNITADRMADRKALRQAMDTLRSEMDDPKGTLAGVDGFNAQALEMLTSPKARQAFEVDREPPKVREKYGAATNLLMARRLVEAGVSVVTVPLPGGSWDLHQNIFPGMNKLLPILDQGLHGLITDLYERGLDKDVAVVVWGEFGRTPRINPSNGHNPNGRHHWPQNGFALLIGGGLKMGQVVGETDARAERAKGKPYDPRNVLATLYHVLGIDPAMTFPDQNGRPTYLLDEREPIESLV